MKPSFSPLLSIAKTVGATRSILYKYGTLVFFFKDESQYMEELLLGFKKFNRINELILQPSHVFDDYDGYYCYNENYPNVYLLLIQDPETIHTQPEIKIKKEALTNYEKDAKSQEIIFDSKSHKISDYEPVMYAFVNNDLNMGKGKIAAQVGHAVGRLIKKLIKRPTQEYIDWDQSFYKKIVLKATAIQMKELSEMDSAMAIHDAGRTQIPSGSLTVVAFPPRYQCNVPSCFSEYKLL